MRVLFLTHRLPYAPNRGDRLRAFHILKALRGRAKVHLISLVHDDQEIAHRGDLDDLAETVHVCEVPRLGNYVRGALSLPSRKPLTHSLLDSPRVLPAAVEVVERHRPDVVLSFCSGMAAFAMQPPLEQFPLVLDMVDVDSQKWRDLSERASFPLSLVYAREARALSRFEALATNRAYSTTVITQREAEALRALAPAGRIVVSPNGLDAESLRPPGPPSQTRDIVFCGVMSYAPNAGAAEWMAKRVWPIVHARHPDARLLLVGAEPPTQVKTLASTEHAIEVTGTVPDVRSYLWNAAAAVAPLQVARGTQNKVLEAVAAGLPVVVTDVVGDGLPEEVLPACVVANSTEAFAEAVGRLLSMSPHERRAKASTAALEALTWANGLAPLLSALEDASVRRR
jgi:sugar transferase (PEP-CTERM/EpsH1 system associated)